jgi:hypothetical protein
VQELPSVLQYHLIKGSDYFHGFEIDQRRLVTSREKFMSLDMIVRGYAVPGIIPDRAQTVEELQEAIVALEKEAEEASSGQHDPFLTTAKRYAGIILQILDRMEADGSLPFNFLTPARKIYGEIRAIGEELAQATEVNRQQYAKEQNALDGYKNFKIATSDPHEVKEFQVPTFGALMERGRMANTEMNIRQNMMLASLIKQGSSLLMKAAKTGFCNATPLNARVCSLAEPHLENAFAAVSDKMRQAFPNQALAHELKVYGISEKEAQEYGDNALTASVILATAPIIPTMGRLAGRLTSQAIKPVQQMLKARVELPPSHWIEPVRVQMSPQRVMSLVHVEKLRTEYELVGKLKASTARLELPIKSSNELMLSDYVHYPHKGATLLVREMGDKAFYVHRFRFGTKRLLPETSSVGTPQKMLERVFEGLHQFANELDLPKIAIAYNPKRFAWASFLQKYGIEITRMGELSSIHGEMLTVAEFDVPSKSIAAMKMESNASIVSKLFKDDAGTLILPGFNRPGLVIAKDLSEVRSLITAQRVNALKKPWAHESLLSVAEDKIRQDLAADAAGVLRKYSWKELEHKVLHIHEGHAYQGATKIPLHSEVKMNYVMFRDGTIRVDFKQIRDMWSFHSSLVRGEGPIAAGEIKFLGGRISYLNEHSGHFLPSNRVQYVEHELRARGAFFTDDYSMHVAEDLMLKMK